MNKTLVDGRAVRLTVLDYGLFHVYAGRIIGISGFLIQTDAGKNVLVDTGFPEKYAADPVRATAEDGLADFGRVLKLDRTNLPRGQLATIGLKPEEIDLLVMTHTHVDHVGGMSDFPQAPVAICAAERALDRPLYHGDCRPLTWPEHLDYVVLDEETDICVGARLLMTPGHAPGQMSLLIDLPRTGAVLLTSDAISRPSEFEEGFPGSWNVALAIENAGRLLTIATERKAFVIYGHCPAQWPTLRKAPAFYD